MLAHRGLAVDAPENTMLAFELAVRAGAEYLETDVHVSADGAAVLAHDPTLQRVAVGRVERVADLALAELRRVDLGAGQGFATLGELLHAFPDLDIVVHDRHVTDRFVILEVTVVGTHLGDWRGLPAMGRRMESRVCALYSFDDQGMLALERTYYDKAKILEQLGIFADPRTTTGKVMAAITPPFAVVRKLGERFFQRLKNRG